jgi:DNA transposition AAA+ family ATPase
MNFEGLVNRTNKYLEEKGISKNALAGAAGISPAALSQFLQNKYQGNNENIAKAVETILERECEKAINPRIIPVHIDTTVFKKIHEVARMCHLDGEIGVCFGDAGLGKTMAARRYAQLYKDSILIEADIGYTPKVLFSELHSMLCTGGGRGTIHGMLVEIIDRLKGTERMIIVDEAENLPDDALELLRSIHDKAGIGILLLGMPKLLGNLRGRKGDFAQLYSRVDIAIKLTSITIDDARQIIKCIFSDINGMEKMLLDEAKGNPRVLWKLSRMSKKICNINKVPIDADVIKRASEVLVK